MKLSSEMNGSRARSPHQRRLQTGRDVKISSGRWGERTREQQSKTRAFTLIELMVVVAIMAIALTMSFPALSGAIHRAPLTKATMDVMEGCRKARERAILTGSPAELRFLADGLIQVADSPEDQDFTASPEGEAAAAMIADAVAPPRPSSAPGFSATLSDTVAIELFEINFTDYMNTEGARIRFYPNGTSDELTLVLRCEGDRRKISLEVVTALASAEPL